MVKIMVHIDKTAALLSGLDRYGPAVVEIPAADLSQEEREELTRHPADQKGRADYEVETSDSVHGRVYTISEATPETARMAIRVWIDARTASAAQETARLEERRLRDEATIQDWLQRPLEDWLQPSEVYEKGCKYTGYIAIYRFHLYDADLKETLAERYEAADRLAKVKTAQAKAQAEQEQRQKLEALRAWAISAGSPTLQARIQDAYEWKGLAETEYGADVLRQIGLGEAGRAETPDGYSAEIEERTTPSLEEIQTIRALRARIGDRRDLTAKLVWVKYTQDDDDSYDGDDNRDQIKRCEIQVAVTCPTGRELLYYFEPGTVATPTATIN